MLMTKEYKYNLSIDNKEMACSRQHDDLLFIGTFCDTLFLFVFDHATKKLLPMSEMATHESIISIAVLSSDLIICGSINGYIDTITCKISKKNKNDLEISNINSKFCHNLGYINCIQVLSNETEGIYKLALACETGLYFG